MLMIVRTSILLVACLSLGLPGLASAEPVSTQLERAVYVEETAGDIDKAIELYQQIIASAEADRPHLAQAQYRLGMCLAKKGRNEEAVAAFKKVVSQYGDQEEVASKAAEQLRKLDYQPLAIQPAPWADGEVMRLRLTTAAGGEIGTIIYTADATEADGRKLWLIRSHLLVTMTNMLQDTVVEAERDSFAPVTGRTLNNDMGDYRAFYEPDEVTLTSTSNTGGRSARTMDLDQPVYDNEQVIYLLRRLPLAQGYRASFMIFPVMGGSLAECRIEVVGTERVTVPAGTYDCYRMNLSVWAGTTKALEHQLWFSRDAHRYLVKYDSGHALMELAEVSKATGEPTAFNDPQLGIGFTVPAGWFVYRHPGEQQGKIIYQLLSPEPGHWSLLAVGAGTKARDFLRDMTVKEVAKGDIEVLKGFFKEYTVRKDSWKELEIGGLPATRFEADYRHQNRAMVEYRTYILGETGVYWFVFRADKQPDHEVLARAREQEGLLVSGLHEVKGQFDALRPTYDEIVDSFRVTAAAVQPVRPMAFGAESTVVLNSPDVALEDAAMSLETGKLLALSRELNTEPAKFRQWMTDNAVNLTVGDAKRADGTITAIHLMGWNMAQVPIPGEDYERATPEGMERILTEAPSSSQGSPRPVMVIDCKPGDKYTAAFKTVGGKLGMFQVTDVDEAGKVHIRYKILAPGGFLPLNMVVERTVYDDSEGKDFLIDFDTGRLVTPQKEDKPQDMWNQGFDAMAETAVRGPGLYCWDMIVIPLDNERWESISIDAIRDDLAMSKPGTPVVMSALEPPRSYIFKTREGSVGALQILELMHMRPWYIRIRYKLLEYHLSTAANSSPVVIETIPAAFANDVDPSLDKITVTFDRPMMNLSWSWVGGGETYPKTTGKPRYDATRTTCSLPVELEPGKVYWVGINSKKFTNFQTEDHVPAMPWVILFATRGEDGRPTPIPEDMQAEARRINEASLRAAGQPAR
jgi:hypothetical protein